jgi:putative transposase
LKATEQGWAVRSYKACQRMIDALPRQVVLKYRFGDDAFKNEGEPFIERDYASLRSNEAWNADHHQFDVIVNAGTRAQPRLVRPWLTAFQDMRSRKIVGWSMFAHDPNSDTILAAFRSAVLDFGVPEVLFFDNGKDFDSYALNGRTKKDRWAKRRVRVELDPQQTAGLFAEMKIDVRHVWKYHGQSKPIERFFGFVETRTCVWPTYCGNSPGERPRDHTSQEDLQLQLERGKAPLLADFAAWFGDFLTAYHAGHEHRGDGMDGKTPDQVYAENLETRRTASRELLDLLCLKKSKPVRVTQNGVTYNGVRYGQYDLSRMIGAEVVLRVDERDATRVQVYTLDDRFVCLASANRKLPVVADAQAVREAIAEKRQDRKRLKEYVDRRPRMADDLPDRIVRAAAARARAVADEAQNDPTPAGPSLQPIRHAMEDQLPALRRALDRTSNTGRVAVGAESLSLASVSRLMQQQDEDVTDENAGGGDAFARLGIKFRGGDAEE